MTVAIITAPWPDDKQFEEMGYWFIWISNFSHSHRGFSPVTTPLVLKDRNRFNGLLDR